MGRTLGELEQLLLMALLQSSGKASGIDLRDSIRSRSGRDVLPGAVYTIMERLRERGLVTSETGDATPARGGRRRKYYLITERGETELGRAFRQTHVMSEGLEAQLLEAARRSES